MLGYVVMINYFKFKFALAKLYREKERMIKAYHLALHEAQAKRENRERIAEITRDYGFEDEMIEDEINLANSDYWLSKAHRLFLPIPAKEDLTMWNETTISDRRALKRKGITEIRSQVRGERKEQMALWLPRLAALTGLVGTLTGLLAVLKK